jgi:hypothetical protein
MRTVQQVAGEKMEGPGMPLIHAKSIEQGLTPPEEKKIATKLTDASASIEKENMPPSPLADDEDILGDEWDFGVSAMTVDAIRILIAGE